MTLIHLVRMLLLKPGLDELDLEVSGCDTTGSLGWHIPYLSDLVEDIYEGALVNGASEQRRG